MFGEREFDHVDNSPPDQTYTCVSRVFLHNYTLA